MHEQSSYRVPRHPKPARRIWRTAALWAMAWAALGFSFRWGKSTGDVMGTEGFWGILMVIGAVGGAIFGSLYCLLRRAVPAPGGRRQDGERLGLRGRLIAGMYGFAVVGLPLGALASNILLLVILGVLGFITASIFPGDADLVE